MNINVAPAAAIALKKILEAKESDKPVRLYVAGFGCSGPSFGLAFDDKKDEDLAASTEGIDFIMQPELHEQYGDFTIEYVDEEARKGFILTPSIQPESGCSSCGGSCAV
jgi:HesB-like selenoprotein